MSRDQTRHKVLLVLPGTQLVRAALEVGLETWALGDLGLRSPDPGRDIALPAERMLWADFGDAPAVRALLSGTVRRHGIGHIVYAENAQEHVPRPQSPEDGLPDAVTLRRVLRRSRLDSLWSGDLDELPTGPRFRVDTVTVGGMHLIIDIVPEGAAPPLSATDRAEIRETVRSVLDLVGYESGSARTDVVLTAEGTRIASSLNPGIPSLTVRRSDAGTVRERPRRI